MIELFGVDDGVWDVDHRWGGRGSWRLVRKRGRSGSCTGCGCGYGDGGGGRNVTGAVTVGMRMWMWKGMRVDVGCEGMIRWTRSDWGRERMWVVWRVYRRAGIFKTQIISNKLDKTAARVERDRRGECTSEQELREILPHLQAGHRSQARYIRLIYVYIGRILSGGRTVFQSQKLGSGRGVRNLPLFS